MFGRILFKMAFENTPKKPARKYIRIYPCDSDDITCRCERMQEPCRLHSRIRYILIGTYPNLLGHHECMRPRPRPPPPLRWPHPAYGRLPLCMRPTPAFGGGLHQKEKKTCEIVAGLGAPLPTSVRSAAVAAAN